MSAPLRSTTARAPSGRPGPTGVRVALAVLAALVVAGPAGAQPASAERGKAMAERLCARCHAIGVSGASPLAEAPPLRTFNEKWPLEQLEEALAEGIMTGHPEMPEFELTPEEIQDLLAYLATL